MDGCGAAVTAADSMALGAAQAAQPPAAAFLSASTAAASIYSSSASSAAAFLSSASSSSAAFIFASASSATAFLFAASATSSLGRCTILAAAKYRSPNAAPSLALSPFGRGITLKLSATVSPSFFGDSGHQFTAIIANPSLQTATCKMAMRSGL